MGRRVLPFRVCLCSQRVEISKYEGSGRRHLGEMLRGSAFGFTLGREWADTSLATLTGNRTGIDVDRDPPALRS